MNRVLEIIVTVIGIIIFGFFTMVGFVLNWMQKNQDRVLEIFEEMGDEVQDLTPEQFISFLNDMGNAGNIYLAGTIIAIIGGIIAIFFLTKNRNPITAGVVLIVSALIALFMTYSITFIPCGIYLITALIAFFRKPKVQDPIEQL